MFNIIELKKSKEVQTFKKELDLKVQLMERNPEILDIDNVVVSGQIQYENHLFILNYNLSYHITLASSRSMKPVLLKENYLVSELFMTSDDFQVQKDLIDSDLVLVVEGDEIYLSESVSDNILLNIPLKVLTPEEEEGTEFPEGNDWKVMTEEEYAAQQETKKEENSPFAGLKDFFEE